MASRNPPSPTKKGKRHSLLEQFPDLDIGSSINASAEVKILPSGLKGSFGRGWPPSSSSQRQKGSSSMANLPFTLRMSQDYRFYNDGWRTTKVEDQPADLSSEFEATQVLMAEIASMLSYQKVLPEDMEYLMTTEMARAVFGSNKIERLGLGLDETFHLCLAVFEGQKDLDMGERSEEYQAKLDDFVLKNTNPGEKAVIRSRREVVQHAAAFQYIVDAFVKSERPMSEKLIKETHAILVKELGKEEAGIISIKDIGGTYRHHDAFAGSLRYTKANEVPKAMSSLVSNLHNDLEEIEKSGVIDPFMLAAKYCDRFVNVHPFRDGNGRMCRLILNAILIKYAGIVVVLGEKDQGRDEYLQIAQESTMVKGHPGQLGKLVLEHAKGTLRRLKTALTKRQ